MLVPACLLPFSPSPCFICTGISQCTDRVLLEDLRISIATRSLQLPFRHSQLEVKPVAGRRRSRLASLPSGDGEPESGLQPFRGRGEPSPRTDSESLQDARSASESETTLPELDSTAGEGQQASPPTSDVVAPKRRPGRPRGSKLKKRDKDSNQSKSEWPPPVTLEDTPSRDPGYTVRGHLGDDARDTADQPNVAPGEANASTSNGSTMTSPGLEGEVADEPWGELISPGGGHVWDGSGDQTAEGRYTIQHGVYALMPDAANSMIPTQGAFGIDIGGLRDGSESGNATDANDEDFLGMLDPEHAAALLASSGGPGVELGDRTGSTPPAPDGEVKRALREAETLARATPVGAQSRSRIELEVYRQSLKDRLGMSDEEVAALLRSSGRQDTSGGEAIVSLLTSPNTGDATSAIGYLLKELRMDPEKVKEATIRYPALLRLTSSGPHAVSSWFQGGLGVSADDVAKIVRRHPSIVGYSIVHNLRPKLRWLQEYLGLSRARAIRLVVRCPAIFGLSINDNLFPKIEWLTGDLCMTKKEAASVVFGNPGIMLSSIDGNLQPKITWLANRLDMEEMKVVDMVRRHPMLLSLSSERNLAPKIDWLSSQASSEVARRVLYRQPSLLGQHVRGNLAPKVQWLQDRLGLTEAGAWNLIARSPSFLSLSVADTLEPKLWWLRDKLEVSLEGAAKLLDTYPVLLDLSIENSLEPKLCLKETLEPKLSWLTHRLDTSIECAAQMVLKYPPLLTYSIAGNLEPKIDFLQHHFQVTEVEPADLLKGLVAHPVALSVSLEKRLVARTDEMRASGVEPVFLRDLSPIARLTKAEFQKWLARRVEHLATSDGRSVLKVRVPDEAVAERDMADITATTATVKDMKIAGAPGKSRRAGPGKGASVRSKSKPKPKPKSKSKSTSKRKTKADGMGDAGGAGNDPDSGGIEGA